MSPEERNAFLYKNRELLPYKRQELILDHLEKAKALIDQELILDKLYGQMDYKTMSNLDRDRYIRSLASVDDTIKEVKRK
jgi:hypothetical protein